MRKAAVTFFFIVLIGAITLECDRSRPFVERRFTETALQGKAIFERNDCGRCHYVGEEVVEAASPSLLNPFLANDSLFVQTHFKFVEETKMPAIELTSKEIQLVSAFLAELHGVVHSNVGESGADARCPVCYAPVSTAQANERGLVGQVGVEIHYFECQDCLNIFRRSPEAFLELLRQHDQRKVALEGSESRHGKPISAR